MLLTPAILDKHRTGVKETESFEAAFGPEGLDFSDPNRDDEIIEKAISANLDLFWAAKKLLTSGAHKAYLKIIAPAQKIYDGTIATASKAYNETIISTYVAYNKTIASTREAYYETEATAYRAYKQAIIQARKAHLKAVATELLTALRIGRNW